MSKASNKQLTAKGREMKQSDAHEYALKDAGHTACHGVVSKCRSVRDVNHAFAQLRRGAGYV